MDLVNQITLSQEDKQFFSENGFIKLKNFLSSNAIEQLRQLTADSEQLKNPPPSYSGDFTKIGYDVEETVTHKIYSATNFKNVLQQLTPQGVAFIQGIGFELQPKQQGFSWHHDLLSLCYVMPEDLAYTLWIPLDPIDTEKQHGGLSYVSRQVHSAREYFSLVYQLGKQEKLAEFCQTEEVKELDFQYATQLERLVLDQNKVEDDFAVGDALLLDKFVWHKSCALKEGELSSRRAYVMRLLDCQARFSKTLLEGTYSLLNSTGNDLQSDIGYKLAQYLADGDRISQELLNL